MKRKSNTTALSLYANERNALMALLAFLFIAFSMYMYFLSVSVLNVVIRQEIDAEIRDTHTELSLLEGRYISAKSNVTEEAATARGFTRAREKTFVRKEPANLVLSRNNES